MAELPFIPFAIPDITEAEVEAVADCVRSGWLTTGVNVLEFEKEFSRALGDEGLYSVAVNSATAGLHLALEAIGIGPGDEVLVPTWTFTATAEVVRYLGADPVFVDVDPDTLNIDLSQASSLVTDRTRAIMPVHFAGLPVRHSNLIDFSLKHDVQVVEDAAHSFPSAVEGTMVGASNSTATVFSFYATKTLATGEGGMVVTRDPLIAQRIRTMRLHGINRDVFDRYTSKNASWYYEVVDAGYKYNMPDPAAAMGRVQLRRSDEMAESRHRIAKVYSEAFKDLPIKLPVPGDEDSRHSWHLYVIRLLDSARLNRDEMIEHLRSAGIGASVHFIPLHRQPVWRDSYQLQPKDFPVAEYHFQTALSLPIFSSMTSDQIGRVVAAVQSALTR